MLRSATPHFMQDTSLQAYSFIKEDLGERYRMIIEGFERNRDKTAFENAALLGFHNPDFTRPRINELAKLGWLANPYTTDYPDGKRLDTVSGHRAMFWRLADDARPVLKVDESLIVRKTVICPKEEVFEGYICHPDPITDYELTKCLGRNDPNEIRPTRYAFWTKGVTIDGVSYHVEAVGERPCMISGRNALTWVLAKDLSNFGSS
jgi:hypothetical protein